MGHKAAAKTRHDSTDKYEPTEGPAYFLWDEGYVLGGDFMGDPIAGTVDRTTTALTFIRAQEDGWFSYTGTLQDPNAREWTWEGRFEPKSANLPKGLGGEWSATIPNPTKH